MIGVILSIAGGLLLALTASRFLMLFYVVGDSMEPTVHEGDWVLARRPPSGEEPHGGDVVILQQDASSPLLIKRVLACPGEPLPPEISVAESVLPEGRFFLIGDNASRGQGAVWTGMAEREQILGKAWLIVWPLRRVRKLG